MTESGCYCKKKSLGFTLAELLIALLILGIIATFTIPKVLSSQQNTKRDAIFKETIAALNNAFNSNWQQGGVTEANCGTTIRNNLNAIKICSANSFTEGCWPGNSAPVAGQQSKPGVILASGAMITGLDDDDAGVGFDFMVIDWNGSAGTNTEGDDEMVVKAVITTTGGNRTGTVRDDAGYPVSSTMYRDLFNR